MAKATKRLTPETQSPPRLGSHTDNMSRELHSRKFASKGERTRHRLKLAALSVLETVGYSEMRVSDVCHEAQVALGTFYVYFKDKKDIATHVLLEFGEALYAGGLKAARGRSAYEAILLTNRFFIYTYSENRGLIRCLVQVDDSVPEFQEQWRKIRCNWLQRIAASIAKRAGGEAASEATRFQIANALEGMVFHFLYDLLVREEPYLKESVADLDAVAELLSLLWYRALYCSNPPGLEQAHELAQLRLSEAR